MTSKITSLVAAFIRSLPVASVGVAGVGLKFYGPSFIILLFFIQLSLSGFDIYLGHYIAKRNKVVNSHIMGDGGLSKVISLGASLLMTIGLGHLAYISPAELVTLCASVGSMLIILFFCYKESISILENGTVISDGENKVVIKWMSGFLRWIGKLAGISVEIAKAKLEKKLESVLPSGTEPKDVLPQETSQ